MTETEIWYSARCLFRGKKFNEGRNSYEERIVLLRSENFEEAIRRAEAEARVYALDHDVDYLEFVQVYHLFEASIGDGTEVFSLIRDSELDEKAYITRFFDTGLECQRDFESDAGG